eukprot:1165497-Alexandrium_andersonii.AAC.1
MKVEPSPTIPPEAAHDLKMVSDRVGGYFVDVFDVQLALDDPDVGDGSGLVLPADDLHQKRIRRVLPPVPPTVDGARPDSEGPLYKEWRTN